MTALRQSFLERRDRIEAAHPHLIAPGWRDRGGILAALGLAIGLYIFGLIALDVSPLRIWRGLSRLWDIVELMMPPSPGSWPHFLIYLDGLGQTLAIAFLGTLVAALLGAPVGFLAARNVVANRILHFLTRRSLDTLRSVDTLIWALIWINVVGLGPFAGALAIASTDAGSLGKLMSEAVEAADRREVEGVVAAGGGRLHALRFGLVPQVLPVFLSQVLYYFESNTRSATIIGVVGAGGIGLHLSEMIRTLEWQSVAFIILMILVAVAAIDQVSTRLRAGLLGARAGR